MFNGNITEQKAPEVDPEQTAAPHQPGEIDVLPILTTLALRKGTLATAMAAAACIASAVAFLLPSYYRATATLMPPQQSQPAATSILAQFGLGPMANAAKDLGLKNPSDIYVAMAKSRVIADALIEQFRLSEVYGERYLSDTRKALKKHSDISAAKEGIITISVEDTDPSRSAKVANAWVEQLRNVTQRIAVTEAAQRRLFFEQQLESARHSLAEAEQAMKQTQQKTGLVYLEGQAKAMIEAVAEMRAQIAATEVQLRAVETYAADGNPDKVMLQERLAAFKAQLQKLESTPGTSAQATLHVPVSQVPAAGLQYIRRMRDLKYNEAMFELLAKQYEIARLDEAKNATVIQVLDPAVKPDKQSSPRRVLIVILAVAFAGVAAAAWVLFQDATRRIRRFDEPRYKQLLELRRALLGTGHPAAVEPR